MESSAFLLPWREHHDMINEGSLFSFILEPSIKFVKLVHSSVGYCVQRLIAISQNVQDQSALRYKKKTVTLYSIILIFDMAIRYWILQLDNWWRCRNPRSVSFNYRKKECSKAKGSASQAYPSRSPLAPYLKRRYRKNWIKLNKADVFNHLNSSM